MNSSTDIASINSRIWTRTDPIMGRAELKDHKKQTQCSRKSQKIYTQAAAASPVKQKLPFPHANNKYQPADD